MLNPVVLPIPFALAVIAALAVCGLHKTESVFLGPTWDAPTPPPAGRHRLESGGEPFRDWAAIAAERITEQAARDLERRHSLVEVAGHDDRPSEADTRELVAVR